MSTQELIIDFDCPGERSRVANGIMRMAGKWRIAFTRYRPRRSDSQNAYLWGVVYPAVRDAANAKHKIEKLTNDDVHEWMKAMFLTRPVIDHGTGEIVAEAPTSTASLDTKAFGEYVDNIAKYARETLGVEIPKPQGGNA